MRDNTKTQNYLAEQHALLPAIALATASTAALGLGTLFHGLSQPLVLVAFIATSTLTTLLTSAMYAARQRTRLASSASRTSIDAQSDDENSSVQQPATELQRQLNERDRAVWLLCQQRDLANALASTTRLGDAFDVCLQAALRVSGMGAGGLYVVDQPTGALDLLRAINLPRDLVEETTHYAADSPQARLVRKQAAVYTTYRALRKQLGLPPSETDLRAVALIPIVHERQLVACLNVASRTDDSIPLGDRHALETIAAQMGSTIARIRGEQTRLRLAAAAEQTAEAMIVTDAHGRIEYVNPAFTRLTGYTHEEAVGHRPSIIKSGRHDDATYRELWETIIRGNTWTGRLTNRRKDGSIFYSDTTISPVRDHDGTIVNYIGLERDVTREVNLESRLRQSQKLRAVAQLAGGVAHEFNNLFTAIVGHTEAITASTPPDHPAARSAERVRLTTDRAAQLVRQLLVFGRKQAVQPHAVDLNDVVRCTVKLLKPMLGKHIRIQTDLARQLHTVRADPSHFEQVLTNLCLNARDAMRNGGTLTIETENVQLDAEHSDDTAGIQPGDYVAITVRDTGCGMDRETCAHLFEPFFTTKGAGRGIGLGLATVHGIVEQHGGRIVVHSVPDEGTTFRVYLPAPGVAAVTQPSPADACPEDLPATTILLVEDETEVREVVRDVLELEDYIVLTADSGSAALDLCRKRPDPIDLLITDVVMPGMNGPQLAKEAVALHPEMKVLYISGYAASFLSQTDQLRPEFAFLAKPFTRAELAGKVHETVAMELPAAAIRAARHAEVSSDEGPAANATCAPAPPRS